VGQPGMEGHEACFYPKTDHQKHNYYGGKPGVMAAGQQPPLSQLSFESQLSQGSKIIASRFNRRHNKPRHQEKHGNMRLDKEVDPRLEDVGFLPVVDDGGKGRKGHDLPGDQEDQAVLDDAEADKGGVKEEEGDVVEGGFLPGGGIAFQVVNTIETPKQKYQVNDQHEPGREGIHAQGDRSGDQVPGEEPFLWVAGKGLDGGDTGKSCQ